MTLADRLADTWATLDDLTVPQPPDVRRPPGPPGRRTLLELITRRTTLLDVFTRLSRDFGDVGYVPLAGEHLYVLSDPGLIWQGFVAEARNTRKSRGLALTRPLLGTGLLNSEGADHLRNRRLVQPVFHRQRIAAYATDMVAATDDLSRGWAARSGGAPIQVDVVEEMSALTLDVVGRTLFGTDLSGSSAEVRGALDTVLQAFAAMLRPGAQVLVRLPTPARTRLFSAIEALDAVIDRVIAEKRAQIDEGAPGSDIVTLLLQSRDEETGAGLTDTQVRDETMTMVLAGHETTAMALSWAIRDLTLSPQALSWLREEVHSAPADGMSDLVGLSRTYAVIAEAMRLHPPAWIISRNLSAPVRLGEWDVPAGATIMASQYAMHRDPRYWAHADEFRPTRWLNGERFDEKTPGVPRGVWFPFGFGTRRCIGEQFAWVEAVLVLARLVREWDIDIVNPSAITPVTAVTMRPSNPMNATLRPRRH